ncbi:MAG: hypothetical protein R3305_09535, partial [Gammaproteobacteria bacterium]|nr:hypothetical protein [Gammaproteobacteria bacterium]
AALSQVMSDPIRLDGRSAIEFGVVLSAPASEVFVLPYLSLNRLNFVAAQFGTSDFEMRDVEPFNGIRPIPFEFEEVSIYSDDLDDAFEILTADADGSLRLSGRAVEQTGLDQGLPATTSNAPRQWSRRANAPAAWGRYRHTFAYIRAGDGETRAVLPAELPSAGRWELELHVPPYYMNFARGTWYLEVVSGAGREAIDYDAAIANSGWNLVGEFELPAGEVRVEFSDRTDGRIVVADAVRWTPTASRSQGAAGR